MDLSETNHANVLKSNTQTYEERLKLAQDSQKSMEESLNLRIKSLEGFFFIFYLSSFDYIHITFNFDFVDGLTR